MSAERRAAVRSGSEVAFGDPNALDSSDGDFSAWRKGCAQEVALRDPNALDFSATFYAGADDFKKVWIKGDDEPRHGAYAVVGLGYTHVKDGDVEADIKGPNIGFGVSGSSDGARVFYKAEAISASLSAGPAKAKVALSADTGVEISKTQVEAKVLGTGVSFGRKMGFSLFGSGFEFELW